MFDGLFELADRRILGAGHLKLTIKFPDSRNNYDAIAFFTHDRDWPELVNKVKLVYRLDVNEYMGRRKLQLIAEYIEPLNQ